MHKTKKKGTQISKAVAQHSIKGIKNGSEQKNKNPKHKSVPERSQTTLPNKSKTQNEDKLFQKTTGTKSNQNLLQVNEKELKAEQYFLKGKENVSNKLQNKSTIKEPSTLNSERNSKERLEVGNSNSNINEGIIPQDSLSDRNGLYEEKELDLIISDIEKSLICKDFDDEDDVSNDVKSCKILRTIVRANDTKIEMHQGHDLNLLLTFKQKEMSTTTVRIQLDYCCREELKEKFEAFGPIKNIRFFSENTERIQLQKQVWNRGTTIGLIDYHSPISARKAFSMNGRMLRGHCMIVEYMDNYPLCLLDNRKYIDNNTIWKLFSTCGEIEYIYLMRDEQTGLSSELGWIVFINEDAAKKAVELNGTWVLDRPIIVKDYSMGFFDIVKVKDLNKETKEIEEVSAKGKKN